MINPVRNNTEKSGSSDVLHEFSHVLFHNNAPCHSKRNLRLMGESMYGKLTREQHDELYELHVAPVLHF